jgi:hypothetical protein
MVDYKQSNKKGETLSVVSSCSTYHCSEFLAIFLTVFFTAKITAGDKQGTPLPPPQAD